MPAIVAYVVVGKSVVFIKYICQSSITTSHFIHVRLICVNACVL